MIRFRLEIQSAAAGGFVVRTTSPRGEGSAAMMLPFEPGTAPALHPDNPRLLGETLFEALFQGDTLSLYERSLDLLAGETDPLLRLELIFDPRDPQVAALQSFPWELLCRPGAPELIALHHQRSIVRYLIVPRTVPAADPPKVLRILAAAAEPRLRAARPLDLEGVLRILRSTVAGSPHLELTELPNATLAALRHKLIEKEFHVLHFLGHGGRVEPGGDQVLFFEKERREADPVTGSDLMNKLAGFSGLRLLVLNACESGNLPAGSEGKPFDPLAGVASALVLGGLPAVIAMRKPISDSAALAWSRGFYPRLAAGDRIETAVVEGRQGVHSMDRDASEWATPILFLRSATGELFPARDLPPEGPPRIGRRLLAALGALLLVTGLGFAGSHFWLERRVGRLVAQGVAQVTNENWGAAREHFAAARRLAPCSAGIAANLAAADEQLGDLRSAEDLYREAARLAPESADRLYDLGHFLNDHGKSTEAYSVLLEAVRQPAERPRNAEVYAELARAGAAQELFARARRAIATALRLEPERAEYHRRQGEIELLAGSPAAAIPPLEGPRKFPGRRSRPDRNECTSDPGGRPAGRRKGRLRFRRGTSPARSGGHLALGSRSGNDRHAPPMRISATSLFSRGERRPMTPASLRFRLRPLGLLAILAALPIAGLTPPPELTARLSQVDGTIEIVGSGVRGLPVANPWQVVRQGVTLRVPARGFAGLVCSNRRYVRLVGPKLWTLNPKGCNSGRLLTESQYALVAPRAGRFSVVAGFLVIDRELRFVRGENPLAPVVFSPRESRLSTFRPAVSWLRTPDAEEYLVEWRTESLGDRYFRILAAEASCRHEPDGLDLCTFPFPADAPALAPGTKFLLTVSARDRTSRKWFADSSVEATTQSLADAARLQSSLAKLKKLGLPGTALPTLEAGQLASQGFYSDAISSYRQIRAGDPSAELRVTLADLYLVTGLDFLAEPLYNEALRSEPPDVRAAAAFGLGRIAYERQHFPEAAAFFEQARKGYAELGLSGEAEAAERGAKWAGERTAKAKAHPP